jgi:hypothetical protein
VQPGGGLAEVERQVVLAGLEAVALVAAYGQAGQTGTHRGGFVVLERHLHVEQGAAAQVALQRQGFYQFVEGIGLVLVGAQGRRAEVGQEGGEAFAALGRARRGSMLT